MVGRSARHRRLSASAPSVFPPPKDLKPGFYYFLASPDPKFTDQNNVVSCNSFWVSTLSIVMRTDQGAGNVGRLRARRQLRRTAGRCEDSKASFARNNNAVSDGPTTKTDKNGTFARPYPEINAAAALLATLGRSAAIDQRLLSLPLRSRAREGCRKRFSSLDRSLGIAPVRRCSTRGSASSRTKRPTTTRRCRTPPVTVDLPGPQRQGNRSAAGEEQRLRFVQRQLHRAARPAGGAT